MWSELLSLAIEDDSADGIHFCIIFPSVSKVFMRKDLKWKNWVYTYLRTEELQVKMVGPFAWGIENIALMDHNVSMKGTQCKQVNIILMYLCY